MSDVARDSDLVQLVVDYSFGVRLESVKVSCRFFAKRKEVIFRTKVIPRKSGSRWKSF